MLWFGKVFPALEADAVLESSYNKYGYDYLDVCRTCVVVITTHLLKRESIQAVLTRAK